MMKLHSMCNTLIANPSPSPKTIKSQNPIFMPKTIQRNKTIINTTPLLHTNFYQIQSFLSDTIVFIRYNRFYLYIILPGVNLTTSCKFCVVGTSFVTCIHELRHKQ